MPNRIYPTIAEAIETHRILIEEFGGSPGIRDFGLLESAIRRPENGYYHDVIEEAAALMESLVNNDPFIDGNKRAGFAVTDGFLRSNGYYLEVGNVQAYEFMVGAMQANNFRLALIRNWIESIVRSLE
jgi:death-on-curing protein